MGLIDGLGGLLFGGGVNVIKDTAEVFMPNAEAEAQRDAAAHAEALQQFSSEFATPRRGRFDRFMDGLNRVPRPALALGTLGLFVAAMVDPVWFAARMQGIQLVPEPLWWLMGAIVSFYFGARAQVKGQDFQRSLAETMARTGTVMRNVAALDTLDGGAGARSNAGAPDAVAAETGTGTGAGVAPDANPALDDWRRSNHA